MDAGVADTINRRDVALIVAHLDALDLPKYNDRRNDCDCVHCSPHLDARHGNGCGGHHCRGTCAMPRYPWYLKAAADIMLRTDDGTRPDRAWWVGLWASQVPTVAFDGAPADCDWDNLFQHFRDAILARRNPETPPARAAENCPGGVV